MTSKQYYRQTSDMAYHLYNWTVDGNTVSAKVFLEDGIEPKDFLDENNFFTIIGWNSIPKGSIDLSSPGLTIKLVNPDGSGSTYSLTVCDTIDCTIGGGDMVFSCSGYRKVEDFDGNGEKSKNRSIRNGLWSIPSFFGSFNDGWFDSFKIPEFTKMDETFDKINKRFSELKNSGRQFCEVSYVMDGDGNGYYRKVDNGGVIEQKFSMAEDGKLVLKDKKTETASDCNSSHPSPPTDAPCCGKSPTKKTELKDLI